MFNRLRRAKRFSEPTAKFYSAEIALALAHLHKSQIIYRDLKVTMASLRRQRAPADSQ